MSSIYKNKASVFGVVLTLGVIFGDIGTSPLYVMNAIVSANSKHNISEDFILGNLSCIIWTLTILTTVKYVFIALKADNNGEGGILALYSLIRKKAKRKWLYIIAILGAATLFSDGVISPSMAIISASEGLKALSSSISDNFIIFLAIIILFVLFSIQQFGIRFLGKFYGPMMVIWFSMLGILGLLALSSHWSILKAFNPYYIFKLFSDIPYYYESPKAARLVIFSILGAVFLCSTGAEGLYSDMGHCGIKNIKASWSIVKVCLILNYLGQGAWILENKQLVTSGVNPFFMIMPESFLPIGIIIATFAALIASQALITGAYTIFTEAMSLNFWPRQKIIYPTQEKGQMYLPWINWALFIGCFLVIIFFKKSSNMEAAYGLAITVTMLMTTILLTFYMYYTKKKFIYCLLFASVYLFVEIAFLSANIIKFFDGGWFTMSIAGVVAFSMYIWYNGRILKQKYMKYVKTSEYLPIIKKIKEDKDIPKYATNIVYITRATNTEDLEAKIAYSIINKNPKRADYYWFLKVDNISTPSTFEYKVHEIIPNAMYKVHFKLGFKVEPWINMYFRQVLEDLKNEGKIDLISNYKSLREFNIPSDFKYVLIDRVFNQYYLLSLKEQFIIRFYTLVSKIGISEVMALGLDSFNVDIEKAPMMSRIIYKTRITKSEK